MQRKIRTAALTAILLVPCVSAAPAAWRALNSAQPAPSYTYQGTVRAVNARAGTLELITGVGMSLRVVRMTMAPTTRLAAAGAAPRLADLKPGDVVRAEGRQKPVKPGDPLPKLSRAERERFDRGKVVFDSAFTPETGLGPLFNATGCGECHEDPAGGRGDEVEVHATAFHSPVCDPLAQEGGPVIQQHTTPALKQALGIDEEPFPPSATARAMRTSPVVFGRGLLDLVPDSVLLAYADP